MDQVKFFKGGLPQILLGPFFNILTYLILTIFFLLRGGYNRFPDIKTGLVCNYYICIISALESIKTNLGYRQTSMKKLFLKK